MTYEQTPILKHVPAAQRDDWQRALQRLYFPISLPAILNHVGPGELGGIDKEVLDILHRLPEQDFGSLEDLVAAVRRVYLADGYAEDTLPV